jgi:hypothetical protein
MEWISYVDEAILLLAGAIGLGSPLYPRIRRKIDPSYKTTRQMVIDTQKCVSSVYARQQLILDVQTTTVQESIGRGAEYWTRKGYIAPTAKSALQKQRDAYYAAGGNDLVAHFWEQIELLPVRS